MTAASLWFTRRRPAEHMLMQCVALFISTPRRYTTILVERNPDRRYTFENCYQRVTHERFRLHGALVNETKAEIKALTTLLEEYESCNLT